jgi:hypothetical protein
VSAVRSPAGLTLNTATYIPLHTFAKHVFEVKSLAVKSEPNSDDLSARLRKKRVHQRDQRVIVSFVELA